MANDSDFVGDRDIRKFSIALVKGKKIAKASLSVLSDRNCYSGSLKLHSMPQPPLSPVEGWLWSNAMYFSCPKVILSVSSNWNCFVSASLVNDSVLTASLPLRRLVSPLEDVFLVPMCSSARRRLDAQGISEWGLCTIHSPHAHTTQTSAAVVGGGDDDDNWLVVS